MVNRMKKVDIIIPIYNAYDDLTICLESILKYTDLQTHRLILVNDNSPDERIAPFLDEQANDNIIVIHNAENKGFPANINIGMVQSDTNDIIMLNSDTIVTSGWVDKIIKCAYSDEAIGTVTPLSNNATLCSVPKMFDENWLSNTMSVNEAASIVEACSDHSYPKIPMGHGFCLFVKREVINTIGMLDAETFARGYGEENDFCDRAEQAGFYHAMCDDTYIYHTGTKSFISEEKAKYIEDHLNIIRERYPKQMRNLEVYVRDNPNSYIGENVGLHFAINNGRKNILYVLHSDFREGASDNCGGTQFHVRDLTNAFKDEINVFVAAMDKGILNLTAYIGDEEFFLRFDVDKKTDFYEFHNSSLSQIWDIICRDFGIDLIHVHHLYGMSFDIFYKAKELDIPIVMTLHDYFCICPTIKLFTDEQNSCAGKTVETEKCRGCLNSVCGISSQIDYISLWRKKSEEIFNICSRLFVPDESTKNIYEYYYPKLVENIKVIPHGYMSINVEAAKTVDTNAIEISKEKKELHVAFIGGISYEKGGLPIANIISNCREKVKWYVMGDIGVSELQKISGENIVKTGRYSPDELPILLKKNQIDVIGIISIWPETYSYTLTEALLNGVPVITTNIGALGRRTEEIDCGWAVSTDNVETEFCQKLHELIENPSLIADKREIIKSISIKSLTEMASDYRTEYNSLYKEIIYKNSNKNDANFIINAFRHDEFTYGISTKEIEHLRESREAHAIGYRNALIEIESIKKSKSYRLGRFLTGHLK